LRVGNSCKDIGKRLRYFLMNTSAQRKNLTILIVFFFLCLGGLGYWYFFKSKCAELPKGMDFMERFVVVNECSRKEYKVKGIIYNIRNQGMEMVFDFNAWDAETKESLYYEDIEVERKYLSGDFDMEEENFGAVSIGIVIEPRDLGDKVFMVVGDDKEESTSDVVSLNVDELRLTEEEYNNVLTLVYRAIVDGPLIEDYQSNFDSLKEKNLVFTEVRHKSLFEDNNQPPYEYLGEPYNGYVNKLLYRPWIISYVYGDIEAKEILAKDITKEDIVEMIVAAKEIDLSTEPSKCGDGDISCYSIADPTGRDNPPVDKTDYQKSNSFACLMMYQISQNIQLNDFDIIGKYCNPVAFEESVEEYIKETEISEEYSLIDYLGILDPEVLTLNGEGRYSPLHSSNTTSLLADTYGLRKLYGSKVEMDNRIDFVLDFVLARGALFLKNTCAISYFANLVAQEGDFGDKDTLAQIATNTEDLIVSLSSQVLRLIEDDYYGAFLCLEDYSGNREKEYRKLSKALLFKIITIDLYNDGEKLGLWQNREYDIRFNARFMKLFMVNKGGML